MATKSWVNFGSGNGLLPDGTKYLPKPLLTNHQWSSVIFHSGLFYRKWLRYVSKICLKIRESKLEPHLPGASELTHWGRVTHICVGKLTIIGSDSGLLPGRRQAIIWTNAGILLIGSSGTDVSEILIKIYTFSFKNMHLKMWSGKWWSSSLGLNVLTKKVVVTQESEMQWGKVIKNAAL